MTMTEDRKRVLSMLADGKITADEAERLLAAMEREPASATASGFARPRSNGAPKYMRVTVDANEPGKGPKKVNIRVTMQLLRAGVRLGSLIPPHARERVNEAMRRKGVDIDINQLKPENLDDLIDQISDVALDVDDEHAKVRIFWE
jgi:hypothetical protein